MGTYSFYMALCNGSLQKDMVLVVSGRAGYRLGAFLGFSGWLSVRRLADFGSKSQKCCVPKIWGPFWGVPTRLL